MQKLNFLIFVLLSLALCSCSYSSYSNANSNEPLLLAKNKTTKKPKPVANYAARLPQTIGSKEKTILIDPNVHAWGAYSNGSLIKAGLATAGSNWCPDIKRACRTKAGSFRIQSLGSAKCKSTIYPLPKGGAPMPYCMFFNKNQGLHGSPYVMEGNVSHGCVRVGVDDAAWIRFNFANVGTKVIVRPY